MKKFYAKIKLDYYKKTCKGVQVVIPTFGTDETNARLAIERLISNWHDVQQYEIVQISTRPLLLYRFEIRGTLKFRSQANKEMYFVLNAETKAEAEDLFREKTGKFFGLISTEITSNKMV